MITKLKEELAWTREKGLSRRLYEPGAKGKRLLESIAGFLEAERKGIKEYEQLRKHSQGLYRDVFDLLYSTMIHDSHKHVSILEFLRVKLSEGQSTGRKRKTAARQSGAPAAS
jgi:hypothetical protein